MVFFARSFFIGMFFIPDQNLLGTPRDQGFSYDDVFFGLAGNTKRNGFFIKPRTVPKGTILHCHGNAGNIASHYPLVLFLVEAGYNVFCFDYQGYGRSTGKPSPEGIIQDTLAALDYLRSREDVNPNKLALFGQSLGGAAAAGAMAEDKTVRCVILEGTFTTYRDMARATSLGKMLFFLTPFVIPDIGPIKDLPRIAPRPVLILHGDEDGLIPVRFAGELYRAASDKKALAILKNFHHLQGGEGEPEYRQAVLEFLAAHL